MRILVRLNIPPNKTFNTRTQLGWTYGPYELKKVHKLFFKKSLNQYGCPVWLPAASLLEERPCPLGNPGLSVFRGARTQLKSTRVPPLSSWELLSGDWLMF